MQACRIDVDGLFVEDVIATEEEISNDSLLVPGRVDGFFHPRWDGAKWIEGDPEAVSKRTDAQEKAARAERDEKLKSTDWLILRHLEEGTAIPANWKSYRKALRDLPAQVGFPHNIHWPKEPEA